MGEKRSRKRSVKEWEELIGRQEASGLTEEEFCRREGVTRASLQRWKSRLRYRDRGRSELIDLTEVVEGEGSRWLVELRFPSGVALRIRG